MKNKNKTVFAAVRVAAVTHRFLTAATLLCVVASVAASLVPPLLLSHIVDRLAAGASPTLFPVLPYFGSLALGGCFLRHRKRFWCFSARK